MIQKGYMDWTDVAARDSFAEGEKLRLPRLYENPELAERGRIHEPCRDYSRTDGTYGYKQHCPELAAWQDASDLQTGRCRINQEFRSAIYAENARRTA